MDRFILIRLNMVVFTVLIWGARCNQELESLLKIKHYISSDPFGTLSNWNPKFPNPCNWTGISCSVEGHVVEIDLWDKGLRGTIAPHLGNLTFLRVLNLSKNAFEGRIPSSAFAGLAFIDAIGLGGNRLTGKIPDFNANCSRLVKLDLFSNSLSGIIPPSLNNCTALETLVLSHNAISGTIHGEIGRSFPRLRNLTLDYNNLSGVIPVSLGNFSQLVQLGLSSNSLVGSFPAALLNCRELVVLKLAKNGISGRIPANIGNAFPKLCNLTLYNNYFTGMIPPSLGNSSKLGKLSLSNNSLVGTIPHSLLNCTHLKEFSFSENKISGTIPWEIGIWLRKMQKLQISRNNLQGRIPVSIGNMSSLISFDAADNKLQGIVPVSLGQLSNLQFLKLDRNQLQSGVTTAQQPIPVLEALLNSSVLKTLTLQGNKLVGALPANLACISNHLKMIDLANNSIGGKIPSIIGNFSVLKTLNLSYNCFTGPIPASLGALKSLQTLVISHNRLSSKIPEELGSMTRSLNNLDLSDNLLSGPIPASIGDIALLVDLSLSKNQLSGRIPPELWKLPDLQVLDLSFNSLSGILPNSIVPRLDVMNLSHNRLTGNVPQWVYSISVLNLSYNDLQGVCSGNHSSNSFLGNPRFTQGCPKSTQEVSSDRKDSDPKIRLIVGIFVGSGILCVLGLIIIWYLRKKYMSKQEGIPLCPVHFLTVPELEIIRATDNFSPRNFLGEGNYGRVYKGILSSGDTVAVKLFSGRDDDNEDAENAERSFTRECATLGQIRHRNLVRIITACCSERMKALILPFMSNGTLHDLLHLPRKEEARLMPLSLRSRLRILTEIANALSYLHHDCSPPVIHCDLKPHNVLLDEEITVHISDFGMARFLGQSAMTASFKLQGSLGYIAPEYAFGAEAWSRGDVYSFGVMVLEIITRIRPTDPSILKGETLHLWVCKCLAVGREYSIEKMINGRDGQEELQESGQEKWPILEELLKLGLQCSSDKAEDRPTMRNVEGALAVLSGVEANE